MEQVDLILLPVLMPLETLPPLQLSLLKPLHTNLALMELLTSPDQELAELPMPLADLQLTELLELQELQV